MDNEEDREVLLARADRELAYLRLNLSPEGEKFEGEFLSLANKLMDGFQGDTKRVNQISQALIRAAVYFSSEQQPLVHYEFMMGATQFMHNEIDEIIDDPRLPLGPKD